MDAETIRPTKLIEDSPAFEDAFASSSETGPHQRVADALLDIISNERGGKMIGLEGGWGSGKSTVVNLLSKQFTQSSDHDVAVFDAWAHEGDPLRRTYLESLIRLLQANRWIDPESWNQRLDAIANRRRVDTTKTVPKPTALGKYTALAALLVPLGIAITADALADGVSIAALKPGNLQFTIGAFVSVGPLIVLLANWLTVRVKRAFGKEVAPADNAIFLSDSITETTTETVETPNPTSIEFEDYFRMLMAEALERKQRRLLLLDRVDADLALELWSTLQTFLHGGGFRKEEWFGRLWILVPYDPKGLRKLWERSGEGGSSDDANGKPVSDSFLDKSFQVRLRVPPPLLSDWKGFLCRLVEIALPEHDEKDRHAIYRVYDQCRLNQGESPTPRELKLFVNQIGAIHRQWQDAFPISHVAYYVIKQRELGDIIEHLSSGELPDASGKRILNGELQANLAGMAFNSPREKGMQLLLGDRVTQALETANHGQLELMAERYPDGFWAVLEAVFTAELSNGHPETLQKAAICLHNSPGIRGSDRLEVQSVNDVLRERTLSRRNWGALTEGRSVGLASLIEYFSDKEVSTHLAKTLKTSKPSSKDENQSAAAVFKGLCKVFDALERESHLDVAPTGYTLPLEANDWIAFGETVAEFDPEHSHLPRVKPAADFKEIAAQLIAKVESGEFSAAEVPAIEITCRSAVAGRQWKELVDAIRERLDASTQAGVEEASALLEALRDLKHHGSDYASKSLAELANGHIQNHLLLAESSKCFTALCVYVCLDELGASEPQQVVGRSAAGQAVLVKLLGEADDEICKSLVEWVSAYDDHDFYFRVLDERNSADPLLTQCLQRVATGESPWETFKPEVVRARTSQIQPILNEDNSGGFSKLVDRLKAEAGLCQSLMQSEEPITQRDALLLVWLRRAAPEDADFNRWCAGALSTFDKDSWISDLAGSKAAIHLVAELRELGYEINLQSGYADALIEHSKHVAVGERLPGKELKSRWPYVLDAMGTVGTRKVFQDNLLDVAINGGGQLSIDFFDLYGSELSDSRGQRAYRLSPNDPTVE